MRKLSSYLLITVKGLCMGAADVIPGVSGGTIAFLTGIYQELLDSIKSVNKEAIKYLFTFQIKKLWKHINGNFLLALFSGIIISLFSLAELMKYLMVHQPIPLWSFFFGLIVASAFILLKDIKLSKISNILPILIGTAIGAAICLLSPAQTPNDLWFIFISGAIAICAMILPGISGSFILLLMGKYEFTLNSLTTLNIPVIATFAAGAVIGIISFSHLLSWLLKKYYNIAISLLCGIMIGSLLKVWPWQIILPSGVSHPALPFDSALATAGQVPQAIIFAIIGATIVITIETIAKKVGNKK